jgi:hypothetical protein
MPQSVLHPSIRLSYFEDMTKWDPSVPACARVLLEHLYETYKEDGHPLDSMEPAGVEKTTSIFMQAIQNMTPADQRAVVTEIESFFSGTYPCLDGDALKWWKVWLLVYINVAHTDYDHTHSNMPLTFPYSLALHAMSWPFPE